MTSFPRSRLSETGAPIEDERPSGTVRNVVVSNLTALGDGCIRGVRITWETPEKPRGSAVRCGA